MKTLSIDIETYSDVQLPKTGVYRYCESDNFEILLFAYSVNSQPVQVIDLACGETIPEEIIAALEDDTVIKWAFNAAFERICLSRFLGYPTGTYLNPESWRCSMIWAATMGLPLSLEGVGAVLGLEKQKLTEGKDLIKYFCQPCAATKANGGRTRNRPFHAPDKWVDEKLMELQQELVKKANNKEAYDEIADQIFALREKRQQASMDTVQRDEQLQRITELQDFIKDQSSDLTVFDKALVKRWLKQIVIWPTHCTVELKSGLKVDVER